MVQRWLWIALAGGAGALARYGLGGLVQRLGGASFPWGTAAVNAAGCLLFGIAVGFLESRVTVSAHLRPLLLIGFLGAFTTFSTFAFESAELLLDRQWAYFAANVVGQNVVGVLSVILGLALGRWL